MSISKPAAVTAFRSSSTEYRRKWFKCLSSEPYKAFIDGTSNTYDEHDDVALLRAADLSLAGHDIDNEFRDWLTYNRSDLARMRLVTFNEDGRHFVNVGRMQRLLTGAVWQLNQRIKALEETHGH